MKFDINSVAAVLCTLSCIFSLLHGNLGAALFLGILAVANYHFAFKNAREDVD